jgi:hypothetical protein
MKAEDKGIQGMEVKREKKVPSGALFYIGYDIQCTIYVVNNEFYKGA